MIFDNKQYPIHLSELIEEKLIPSVEKLSTTVYKNMPCRAMIKKYLIIDGYKIIPVKERLLISAMDGTDTSVISAEELNNQFADIGNIREDDVDVLYMSLHPGPIDELVKVSTDYPTKVKDLANEFKIPEANKLGDQAIMDEVLHIIEEGIPPTPTINTVMIDVTADSMPEENAIDAMSLLSRTSNGVYVPYQSPGVLFKHLNTEAHFLILGGIK